MIHIHSVKHSGSGVIEADTGGVTVTVTVPVPVFFNVSEWNECALPGTCVSQKVSRVLQCEAL